MDRLGGWHVYSDGWEERLPYHRPMELKSLQTELTAYATELLLCLGAPAMAGNHPLYTQTEVHTVVSVIIRSRDIIRVGADVDHALHIINDVLKAPYDDVSDSSFLRFSVPTCSPSSLARYDRPPPKSSQMLAGC